MDGRIEKERGEVPLNSCVDLIQEIINAWLSQDSKIAVSNISVKFCFSTWNSMSLLMCGFGFFGAGYVTFVCHCVVHVLKSIVKRNPPPLKRIVIDKFWELVKKKPKNGNHSWEIRISFECWTTGAKPTLGPNCRFRTTISPVKVCSRMNLVFFWLIEVCCNLWIFLGGWKHRIYTTNIYCMTLSIVSLTN